MYKHQQNVTNGCWWHWTWQRQAYTLSLKDCCICRDLFQDWLNRFGWGISPTLPGWFFNRLSILLKVNDEVTDDEWGCANQSCFTLLNVPPQQLLTTSTCIATVAIDWHHGYPQQLMTSGTSHSSWLHHQASPQQRMILLKVLHWWKSKNEDSNLRLCILYLSHPDGTEVAYIELSIVWLG